MASAGEGLVQEEGGSPGKGEKAAEEEEEEELDPVLLQQKVGLGWWKARSLFSGEGGREARS